MRAALALLLLWPLAAHAEGALDAANERLAAAARAAAPGSYPRSWLGEPLYWTVVGTPDGAHEALLSDEGALEPAQGGFSLVPYLFVEGARITAHDALRTPALAHGDLPLPALAWEHPRARLRVLAFAPDDDAALASYRVENPRDEAQRVELWLALRPFQVLPPWQFLNVQGGFAPIRGIALSAREARVNGVAALWPLTPPDAFGAAPDFVPALESGALPAAASAKSEAGLAGGAWVWRFTLAPREAREVHVRAALHPGVAAPADGGAALVRTALAATTARWRTLLGRAEIDLPAVAADVEETLRAALGHILVNRDGPKLQPGSRNYERSWIRDGALSSSALVQLGHADTARAFLAWYAPFQAESGALPCCVDARGADPTPEHDSTGAFLYALGEYARHTRDAAFVRTLWPRVLRAVAYLERLRGERLTPRFRSELGGATFGILPESISHEGYAKRAVHSYWDDLFAQQGLRDAVFLAELVGDAKHAAAWSTLRDAFSADLFASYQATQRLHAIPHLAGSVELGDFDPTATALGFELGGEPRDFPEPALRATFARYLGEVAERKRGVMARDAFAPYEIRIASALIRMGDRDGAWDVLALNLAGRRPRSEPQANEAARAAGHPGDAPALASPRSEPKASEAEGTARAAGNSGDAAASVSPRSEPKASEAEGTARAAGNSGDAAASVSPRSEPKASEAEGTARAAGNSGDAAASVSPRSEPQASEAVGWRQWPEIVWTDETRGQWLGDLPHGWIGATFVHAVRAALVYERASDQALVLAAGVPAAWLAGGEPVRVARLSTWWGALDYELRREGAGALRMRVAGGLRVPPGGVVLAPPGVAPQTLRTLPADVVLRYQAD